MIIMMPCILYCFFLPFSDIFLIIVEDELQNCLVIFGHIDTDPPVVGHIYADWSVPSPVKMELAIIIWLRIRKVADFGNKIARVAKAVARVTADSKAVLRQIVIKGCVPVKQNVESWS